MDGRLDSLQEMAAAHGRHGTTSLLAGAVTASQEALEAVAEMVKEAMDVSRQVEWGRRTSARFSSGRPLHKPGEGRCAESGVCPLAFKR